VIGEPMSTSESCHDELIPDDPNVTPSNGKTGLILAFLFCKNFFITFIFLFDLPKTEVVYL
jgi:hypothetical protein